MLTSVTAKTIHDVGASARRAESDLPHMNGLISASWLSRRTAAASLTSAKRYDPASSKLAKNGMFLLKPLTRLLTASKRLYAILMKLAARRLVSGS